MKLVELYEIAVKMGRERDPRGEKGIERILADARKEHDDLPEDRRWEFDRERLNNPFSDTRILVGEPDDEVSQVLVGIDMSVAGVLLADRLRERGRRVDLIIAHHPEGRALADLQAVMGVQADIWRRFGVPINFGDAVISDRMSEIRRHLHADNTEQAIQAARLLGIPFMCCHTPSDNCVHAFLQEKVDGLDEDARVRDVLELLKKLPEYQEGVRHGTGPMLFAGSEDTRAGKVMVDMTGGTSGPVEALEKLASAGVGTIVGMHMSDEHRKKADELHLNVVIAGHMASDSLGMNLIMDEYERRGVGVSACSGFIRASRVVG